MKPAFVLHCLKTFLVYKMKLLACNINSFSSKLFFSYCEESGLSLLLSSSVNNGVRIKFCNTTTREPECQLSSLYNPRPHFPMLRDTNVPCCMYDCKQFHEGISRILTLLGVF
jgi:hypothetical protein